MLYWLAKEYIANRKYNTLRQLLSNAGYKLLDILDARGNASYTSHQFVNVEILEEVNASPACGLMIDETTGMGTVNFMNLIWRFVNMKTGRVRQRYAGETV